MASRHADRRGPRAPCDTRASRWSWWRSSLRQYYARDRSLRWPRCCCWWDRPRSCCRTSPGCPRRSDWRRWWWRGATRSDSPRRYWSSARPVRCCDPSGRRQRLPVRTRPRSARCHSGACRPRRWSVRPSSRHNRSNRRRRRSNPRPVGTPRAHGWLRSGWLSHRWRVRAWWVANPTNRLRFRSSRSRGRGRRRRRRRSWRDRSRVGWRRQRGCWRCFAAGSRWLLRRCSWRSPRRGERCSSGRSRSTSSWWSLLRSRRTSRSNCWDRSG